MPSYDYSDLNDNVNGMVRGKLGAVTATGSLKDKRVTLNRAVRFVVGDVDLRSTKRRVAATPSLFNDIFDYSCPTDMKATQLIDVAPQANRAKDSELRLTTEEEFDRFKDSDKLLAAFADRDFVRKLRISLDIDDDELLVSELDGLNAGGGTWAAFGKATNLTADTDNYIKGAGSINWDIGSGAGTTAGIENTDVDDFDIIDYLAAGSAFVWVYITDKTNITNFILRLGQDASNFYAKTITTVHEGTAFVNGWNLLRFDLQSLSQTGSPTSADCDYVALYMTIDAAKVSETDYRFDWLVLKRGKIHNILYYSKLGWQTSGGTYIENSTANGDLLNADTEELELITFKAAEFASQELNEKADVQYFNALYEKKKQDYVSKWPSEAKAIQTTYYEV